MWVPREGSIFGGLWAQLIWIQPHRIHQQHCHISLTLFPRHTSLCANMAQCYSIAMLSQALWLVERYINLGLLFVLPSQLLWDIPGKHIVLPLVGQIITSLQITVFQAPLFSLQHQRLLFCTVRILLPWCHQPSLQLNKEFNWSYNTDQHQIHEHFSRPPPHP